MRRYALRVALAAVAVGVVFLAGFVVGNRVMPVHGAEKPGTGFAVIPGEVGGQDIFGAYEVVKDWPKNISTLPGNEKWTWGAGQSIYAENPNRDFPALPRRTAQHQAAGDEAASGVRPEPPVPHRPPAVA